MDVSKIISFERGFLYLKLREEFDTTRMRMHHTMAEITKDGVKVVQTYAKKATRHVSPDSMTLTCEEALLLAEGVLRVKDFWETSPVPAGHVLLSCGCIVDWQEHNKAHFAWLHGDEEAPAYASPLRGLSTWCDWHEDATVERFNAAEYEEVSA